jgi:hypothetical protein
MIFMDHAILSELLRRVVKTEVPHALNVDLRRAAPLAKFLPHRLLAGLRARSWIGTKGVKSMSDMPRIDWPLTRFVLTMLSAERAGLRASSPVLV